MKGEGLARVVLKWRLTIILLSAIISIFMVIGFHKLRVESDISKWLKQDSPEIQSLKYISEIFGGTDLAMVAIETENVFTYPVLQVLAELQKSYETVEGVSGVTSLMNIVDIRGTESGIEVSTLIDKFNIPETPDSLKKLRNYVLSRDIYSGKIVSTDGRIALFLIKLKRDVEKPAVADKIRNITEKILKDSRLSVKVYYSGSPMLIKEINKYILGDMKRLVPFVIVVVLVVLFLGMRTWEGVVLPLGVVLLSSLWSMSLMAWLNIPLSVISNTIPVLLIAIGTAYGIHVITRYKRNTEKGVLRENGIKATLREVSTPVFLAALTTITAFLSFLGSYIRTISHFGIFTALGVFFSMLLSLLLIPAVLSYLRIPRSIEERIGMKTLWYEKMSRKFSEVILKHERITVMAGILILVLGIVGLTRLKTSASLMDYFPKKSELRKSTELLRNEFGGDIPVYVLVKGDLKNPLVLDEMLQFEKYMRIHSDISFPQSVANLIARMNDVLMGVKAIPETKSQVENLTFMLEGQALLSQLVNSDYSEGIIQANASLSAYAKIKTYLEHKFVKNIISVKLDTVKDAKEEILSYWSGKIAERIIWDLRYWQKDTLWDAPHLKDTLHSLYSLKIHASKELIEELSQSFSEYFEEEAGVFLSSSKIQKLVKEFLNEVQNRNIDTTKLNRMVKKYIPRSLVEEDPEMVGYTQDRLMSIVIEKMKAHRIQEIYSRIAHLFPDDLNRNKEFVDEIKGEIFTFLREEIGVPLNILNVSTKDTVKIGVIYSGLLPVEKKIDENLFQSQIRSLLIALFVVTLLVSIQLKSFSAGFITVSPIILVVAINFGIMGFFGIKLDSGTMMVASIAIGIGIDYAIHFISHFKEEYRKTGDVIESLHTTIHEKGRAIVVNALTVGLGFLILVFANLVPVRNFGWLLALTMLTSATLALSFLPALILIAKKSFIKNKGEVKS